MQKILNFLELTETNKTYKFFYYLFLPITYLLEYICFRYYWKFILENLLTNDEMVNFLDKNEFGINSYKIYKKDIIEQDEFLNHLNLDELKLQIKKEMSTELIKKISEISAFDLENYINITVNIYIIDGIKQYEIQIKYFRHYMINYLKSKLFIWIILMISVLTGIYLLNQSL